MAEAKKAFSSHLSHPEKTVTAKNEESNFQQASVWEGRLPWGSDGELKARKKAHISSVCWLNNTGYFGQSSKISRLLSPGQGYFRRQNISLDRLSDAGRSGRHCWAYAMVSPCSFSLPSFALQNHLRWFLNSLVTLGKKCIPNPTERNIALRQTVHCLTKHWFILVLTRFHQRF